jgi:cysteine desulfurase/selenocysteine lyase
VDYALGWGLEASADRIGMLADRLRAGLAAIDGVSVRDLGAARCGIVTFTVDGMPAEAAAAALSAAGINVSVTPASYSRTDLGERGLAAVVRASVHYYNTEDELGRLLSIVAGLR